MLIDKLIKYRSIPREYDCRPLRYNREIASPHLNSFRSIRLKGLHIGWLQSLWIIKKWNAFFW